MNYCKNLRGTFLCTAIDDRDCSYSHRIPEISPRGCIDAYQLYASNGEVISICGCENAEARQFAEKVEGLKYENKG